MRSASGKPPSRVLHRRRDHFEDAADFLINLADFDPLPFDRFHRLVNRLSRPGRRSSRVSPPGDRR